jgi:NADH-quinone oxidoreductase subunit L
MGVVMTFIAALTAFYMFRLYYNIFRASYRTFPEKGKDKIPADFQSVDITVRDTLSAEYKEASHLPGFHGNTIKVGQDDKETAHHPVPHEAPASMTIPLIFLAVVTCVAGFIPFGEFVSSNGTAYHIHLDMKVAVMSVCVAVAAIAVATLMYKSGKQTVANKLIVSLKRLYRAAYHRFYIDEIYQFVTHKIIFNCISKPIAWFDRHVVDGFMNSLAWVTNVTGSKIKGIQSGAVQQYAVVFLSGTLVLIIILLLI